MITRRRGRRPPAERRRERPDESAAQVGWLVAAVGVAVVPHLLVVIPWVPALVIAISAWRLVAARRRWPLPGALVRVPLTLGGFTAILATYRQVSGVDAGSALLMVMVAMKLLETRGPRDRSIVIFICYFLLFAAFLREQALWSLPYLLAALLVTTAALLQTSRSGNAARPGRAVALAGRLLAQALPLAAILFVLFPRVPGPFWALPQRGGEATSGLAESMSPGDITDLALSDEVAFRVRFDGPVPRGADLYWRGPVLEWFDGRRWHMRGSAEAAEPLPGPAPEPVVGYELTLEPHGRRWLLALDTPLAWDAPRARLGAGFELVGLAPVDRRFSYRARAALTGTTASRLSNADRTVTLALPAAANPRSAELARRLRAEAGSETAFVDAVLARFRNEPFYYTLKPAALGAQSIDEFLFETREGFCGHYAAAFAFLARAAGIPARIVTGYQGGELNPLGSYWLVRQADAHAWNEVWIDGRWRRVDPTAAVAPERIEWGMDAAIDGGRIAGAEGLRDGLFGARLTMSWDAVNAAWNRWVLSFGPDAQAELLAGAGIQNPGIRHLVVALVVALTTVMGALAWFQASRGRPKPDPLGRAYRTLCARTARATRPRRPQETPLEYARACAALRPELGAEVNALFGAYTRLRYESAGSDASAMRRFRRAVAAFRPPRRRPA